MSSARTGAAEVESAAPARATPSWIASALKVLSVTSVVAVLAIIGVRAGPHGMAHASGTPSTSSTPAASVSASAGAHESVVFPASTSPSSSASAISSASASSSAGATGIAGTPGTLADGRVVLNLATEPDLVKLHGIGPTRAKAILALRDRLGGKFRSINDLLRVKGLGRKTLEKLRPSLLLDAPPAA